MLQSLPSAAPKTSCTYQHAFEERLSAALKEPSSLGQREETTQLKAVLSRTVCILLLMVRARLTAGLAIPGARRDVWHLQAGWELFAPFLESPRTGSFLLPVLLSLSTSLH